MQKIVVCGRSESTGAVCQQLLLGAVPVSVAVYEPDPTVVPLAPLEAVAKACGRSFRRGTLKTLAAADVLIVTDFESPQAADFIKTSLDRLRKVMNEAMSKGFAGKVIVATHQDALLTYFAQRFSGLSKTAVLGLGTFGLTQVFEHQAANALSLPVDRITGYAVGTASDFLLVWSRAYVAATPLMSLMKDVEARQELLEAVQSACTSFSQADTSRLWPTQCARLVAAFAGDALIAPLTVVLEDAALAYARPVLVNQSGVHQLVTVSGTEQEESVVADIKATIETRIAEIEQGD